MPLQNCPELRGGSSHQCGLQQGKGIVAGSHQQNNIGVVGGDSQEKNLGAHHGIPNYSQGVIFHMRSLNTGKPGVAFFFNASLYLHFLSSKLNSNFFKSAVMFKAASN